MSQTLNNLKILAIVEATTVNAVAKNVLDFRRSARELNRLDPNFPAVELSIVTFAQTQAGALDGPLRRAEPESEFVNAARASGAQVDVITERGRFDRRIVRKLREIAGQQQPHAIVTHSVKSHFVMFRSGLWRTFPWVAFHHGYTATDLKMRFYNLFDRRSLPKADRVITVCEAFAQELVETKGVRRDRISVQHNSIRPAPMASAEEARTVRAQLGLETHEKIILAVGRLSKEKAQANLIEAFKLLRDANPELKARLVIVGDGPEHKSLAAAAASFRISDRIIFTGHVRNVQPYYAMADVLANSSHSEGSPYVLLEAMAAGLPIVATAVGGVPEMLKDEESALLVPPRDRKAMTEAIARVLADEDLAKRLATNASGLIATRFAPETYVRSLVAIYRNVIDGRALRGR